MLEAISSMAATVKNLKRKSAAAADFSGFPSARICEVCTLVRGQNPGNGMV